MTISPAPGTMLVLAAAQAPTDGVRLSQAATVAYVANENLGPGTLYITESVVSWCGGDGRGFTVDYPSISLHAISRDLAAFPHENLLLMVDGDVTGNTEGDGDGSDDSPTSDIRFVPQDKGALNLMYQSMCDCASLHPDPNDSPEDDDDEFEGGGDYMTPEGQVQLDRLEDMMDGEGQPPQSNGDGHEMDVEGDEDQFEDAD